MPNFVMFDKFTEAVKFYQGSKYEEIILPLQECIESGRYNEALKLLESLPSKKDLLLSLTEKLKNKSVYKTLKKISEGKISEGPELLKGLFSLGTHIAIEVEKGNTEYRILYPLLYEKLGRILYRS